MSRKCCKRFEDVPKTDSKLVSKKNQTVRCPKIDAQDFTLVKKIMISHAHKVIEDPNVKENIKFFNTKHKINHTIKNIKNTQIK